MKDKKNKQSEKIDLTDNKNLRTFRIEDYYWYKHQELCKSEETTASNVIRRFIQERLANDYIKRQNENADD